MGIVSTLYRITSQRERIVFWSALILFCAVLAFWVLHSLDRFTNVFPTRGGTYIEGEVGQPSFINPLFVGSNDVDRDLVEVLFKDVLALAETYKVQSDGKTWVIRLRDAIFWHDGVPVTSDDVVFTIEAIQNPDARSPLFSAWQGVRAERVSEREVRLTLPGPYAFFEEQLRDLRPIPRHLFYTIPPSNFRLSTYILEPIGNGPFRFSSFQKNKQGFITRYTLIANEAYFNQRPYFDSFVFRFFSDEDALILAFNSGDVHGVGGMYREGLARLTLRHEQHALVMPRYYAVFFNQFTHPAIKDSGVRTALRLALDKGSMIRDIFDGAAITVRGPLLPTMPGYNESLYPADEFSLEKAGALLDARGWKLSSDGVRTFGSSSTSLALELVVPQTNPFLMQTATFLKDAWAPLGVSLTVRPLSAVEVSEVIKTRNYQMLLFGNVFGRSADLYSFWHSSERFYPGLNLSLYDNKTVDGLIESVRKTMQQDKRARDWETLQLSIVRDAPVLFLYSPHYMYAVTTRLNGFTMTTLPLASDRFDHVEDWYFYTERVFK